MYAGVVVVGYMIVGVVVVVGYMYVGVVVVVGYMYVGVVEYMYAKGVQQNARLAPLFTIAISFSTM